MNINGFSLIPVLLSMLIVPIVTTGYYGVAFYKEQKLLLRKYNIFSTPTPKQVLGASYETILTTPDLFSTSIPVATIKPRKMDGGYLFNLVNAYRLKNGLKNLSWYLPLCEYSKVRSQQIRNDWSHSVFLEDTNAGTGILYKKYCPECKKIGENLAKDFMSEESVLQAWITSLEHKENLDDSWDYGCAIFFSNNYVAMIFGKK